MTVRTLILAGAACLAIAAPASATPAVPTPVFDPPSTGWVSLRNSTSAQFAERFDQLKRHHMVIDLEVDVIDGQYRVGAVFRKNPDGRGWASLRNLTSAKFHERWQHYKERGYRLVDQETYVQDGRRLYAGVWVENREGFGWASYRGVTSAEFSERFDDYRDRGYLPVDFEVYDAGGSLRYGAIWVENRESLAWKLRRNMTSAQFSSTFQSYADEGLRSLDFEAIETPGGRRYAGIWVENRSHRGWYLYRDLTATQYRNRWNQLADKGYRLDNYEKYDTASGVRYSGIWRQNSSRPNWPLRTEVDELVQDERDDHDVPGISVAVSHEGNTVYLRGVGHQDVEDGVWMHSGSVNRLASVSKAVAGVLAMRMDAKHASLSMGDAASEHLSLPDHHTYTVAQTVMNRSCVDHYPDGFSAQNQTHYDTALAAVEEFMDQPLSCTPGQYLYSTHAYTVFAAILEQLEGKSADQIALDELTLPFGLKTLRTENLAASLPDRATLYTSSGNEEYDGDDTSNKWYGGGFVANARDLTRFGVGILDGTILTEDQREEMWTPIGSYAYGWDVGSADNGERVVGKSGGQPGANAYLRIYPDDDIVISVLTNRWKGGHSARLLSREIGELMLDEF